MDVNLTDKGEQSEMLCPTKGFEKIWQILLSVEFSSSTFL